MINGSDPIAEFKARLLQSSVTVEASAALPGEKLFTLKAAGIERGIPYFKMLRAAKLGLFPIYKFGNSRGLVRLSEIDAAIDGCRVSNGAL